MIKWCNKWNYRKRKITFSHKVEMVPSIGNRKCMLGSGRLNLKTPKRRPKQEFWEQFTRCLKTIKACFSGVGNKNLAVILETD